MDQKTDYSQKPRYSPSWSIDSTQTLPLNALWAVGAKLQATREKNRQIVLYQY